MIYEELPVQINGSAPYAKLQCYIWSWSEDIGIEDRPLILVMPGGGYHRTTDREGEPVALRFMAMGYHVAVLRYSVAPVRWPVSLYEVAHSLDIVGARAGKWHIDMGRVILMGFSAGGHLAASYGVYWNQLDREQTAVRPAGQILCYPVISADPAIWHENSIRQLLGKRFEDQKLRDIVSLEKHVSQSVPPTFIWNTKTDETVPARNSEVFTEALRQQGIPVEYHEYPTGGHGLSLANVLSDNRQHTCCWPPCEDWPELAKTWLEKSGLSVKPAPPQVSPG